MPKRSRSPSLVDDTPLLDRLSMDDDIEKEIKLDFEFFQFQQDDYHDLKIMLRNYLGGDVFELEDLCNELIEQFYIGSSIKIEGTEQFVGLLTCFNIISHKEKQCIKSIKKYFLNNLCNDQDSNLLSNYLNGDHGNISLILSERIESVPVLLTPHLYIQLQNEINLALKTEIEDNVEEFEYKIDYLLIKTKVFFVTSQNKKKKVKFTNEQDIINTSEGIYDEETGLDKFYYNPEEELLYSYTKHIWKLKTQILDCSQPNSMDRHVVQEEYNLLLIPMKSLPEICKTLQKQILGK